MNRYIEVVINEGHGGFGVSEEGREYAKTLAKEAGKINEDYDSSVDICRHDRFLVQAVKVLGKACNGMCAKLGITKIPYKYKHKYECERSDDSGWETIKVYNREEDGKSKFCKDMYYMPDPSKWTPEECKAKLLEIYKLKEDYLPYERYYDASDPETDSNKGEEYDSDEEDLSGNFISNDW